jgi:hypothetical protein
VARWVGHAKGATTLNAYTQVIDGALRARRLPSGENAAERMPSPWVTASGSPTRLPSSATACCQRSMLQSRVTSVAPRPPSTYANRRPFGATLKSKQTFPSCLGRRTRVVSKDWRDKTITTFSAASCTDTKSLVPSCDHCGALQLSTRFPIPGRERMFRGIPPMAATV